MTREPFKENLSDMTCGREGTWPGGSQVDLTASGPLEVMTSGIGVMREGERKGRSPRG